MKLTDSKDFISNRQAIIILIFFLCGLPSAYNIAKSAGNDSIFAIITAALLTIPIYLLFSKIINLYPHQSIYQILPILFGKGLGTLITLLLIFNGFYITALSIRTLAELMQIAGLINTSYLTTTLLICLITILILKNRLNIYGKWAELYFTLFIVVFAFVLITNIPMLSYSQVLPFFYDGYDKYIHASISTFFYPFASASIFLSIFNNLKNPKDAKKIFLKSLTLTTIISILLIAQTIMIISSDRLSTTYFPLYLASRRVRIGTIVQRIEFTVIFFYLISTLGKIIICSFNSVIGLTSLFKINPYTKFTVPVILLSGMFGVLAYENIMERELIIESAFMPYSLLINIFIPLLILITHYIKKAVTR